VPPRHRSCRAGPRSTHSSMPSFDPRFDSESFLLAFGESLPDTVLSPIRQRHQHFDTPKYPGRRGKNTEPSPTDRGELGPRIHLLRGNSDPPLTCVVSASDVDDGRRSLVGAMPGHPSRMSTGPDE